MDKSETTTAIISLWISVGLLIALYWSIEEGRETPFSLVKGVLWPITMIVGFLRLVFSREFWQ